MLPIILAMALSQTPNFEWKDCSNPDQIALFQDGEQVGLWDYKEGKYYPLVEGRFKDACICPVNVPAREKSLTANYGIDLGKIEQRETYIKNGQRCSRREALDAISAVPDDRKWLRLTVIGPDASRSAVLNDLKTAPALQPWKDKLVVQDYAPTDWAVRDAGFFTAGSPTIYLQMPSGKVLHRQDSYAGADDLASSLRKADPSYKPDADPNVNKPSLPSLPSDWKQYLPYLLAAAGVFLLWRTQK